MTTITREQQKQILIDTANHVISRDNTSPYSENLRELARIALASLDAEPVGYFYADKPGDWYQISDGDRVPDHRRIPLYSSPQPGQVVKLPNEFISNEGIVVQIEKVMAVLAVHGVQYKRRGNACNAAMLQAGNHTEQHLDMVDHSGDANEKGSDGTFIDEGTKQAGNSPVIPDGYALVPVEPTPEMREAFHVANEEYESGSYDVWKPDHQWQAMLAAAPQLKIALASIERCQAGFDAKHALFEVAIARFSKMNEGFPIKRFKADWVISWMLENFPPVAQKQGDN